jgi:hypothetical protein
MSSSPSGRSWSASTSSTRRCDRGVAVLAAVALAFSGPIVIISALGIALIELYNRSTTFRNIVNAAFQAVHDKVFAVMPAIKTIIVTVVTAAEAVWERFGAGSRRSRGRRSTR